MDDFLFYLVILFWYKTFTPVHILDTFYKPVFDAEYSVFPDVQFWIQC